MQLTKKEAKRLGLLGENSPAKAPRSDGGTRYLEAGRSERTGLTTLILAGWSVQSPDSIRYRLFVINQPDYDTGLCADEFSACAAAKALERTR